MVSASASLIASSSRGRSAWLIGVANHSGQLGPAVVGDLVRPLPPVGLRQRPDEPVALEPGQRGVDLPDVQRPGAAGGVLELGPQLVAVAGAPLQQGEQTVFDAHSYAVCIPRMFADKHPDGHVASVVRLARPGNGTVEREDAGEPPPAGGADGAVGQRLGRELAVVAGGGGQRLPPGWAAPSSRASASFSALARSVTGNGSS